MSGEIRAYVWTDPPRLDEIEPGDDSGLTLADLITGPSTVTEATDPRNGSGDVTLPPPNAWLMKQGFALPDVIPVGQRDDVLYRYACSMHGSGVTRNEAIGRMDAVWRTCEQSPRDVYPWEQARANIDTLWTSEPDSPAEARVDVEGESGAEAAITATVRERFPRIDWGRLWADELVEEWIIEPLLPVGRLVAIFSAAKVGKSLLCVELAAGIASGRRVLGTTPTPRRVLYVDMENDPRDDVRSRLRSMGYGPADLGRLDYLSFPTLGALDSAQGGADLLSAVAAYSSEVVVIDTVSRVIAGDENDNDTWLKFYRHTGLLLKRAGVACIRLDHSGKDETKGMRGGSAKYSDVDAVWKLTQVVRDHVYRLDCTDHRMRVTEPMLTLHRETVPHLRHVVDAYGRAAAFDAKVDELTRLANAANLPADANRNALRELGKAHGLKLGTDALAEVVRKRRASTSAPGLTGERQGT